MRETKRKTIKNIEAFFFFFFKNENYEIKTLMFLARTCVQVHLCLRNNCFNKRRYDIIYALRIDITGCHLVQFLILSQLISFLICQVSVYDFFYSLSRMIVIFNDESDVILFLIVGRSATCLRLTMAIDSSVVASSNLKNCQVSQTSRQPLL